jgi:hypothetical protein
MPRQNERRLQEQAANPGRKNGNLPLTRCTDDQQIGDIPCQERQHMRGEACCTQPEHIPLGPAPGAKHHDPPRLHRCSACQQKTQSQKSQPAEPGGIDCGERPAIWRRHHARQCGGDLLVGPLSGEVHQTRQLQHHHAEDADEEEYEEADEEEGEVYSEVHVHQGHERPSRFRNHRPVNHQRGLYPRQEKNNERPQRQHCAAGACVERPFVETAHQGQQGQPWQARQRGLRSETPGLNDQVRNRRRYRGRGSI